MNANELHQALTKVIKDGHGKVEVRGKKGYQASFSLDTLVLADETLYLQNDIPRKSENNDPALGDFGDDEWSI